VPINNIKWLPFVLDEIFMIKAGKRLVKSEMKAGYIPFVGASEFNNGITEFISNKNASLDRNVLGVNYNGSVVNSFYHPYQAVFSDDVKRLSFRNGKESKFSYLFVKTAILRQKCKYEYGYKFNEQRMKKQRILLPANTQDEPDYSYMEQYVQNMEYQKLKKYQAYIQDRLECC